MDWEEIRRRDDEEFELCHNGPDMNPEWHCPLDNTTYGDQNLEYVHHVTHIDHALEILNTGFIKADLVYDHSKLNQERIKVSWLSPNHWHRDGYRYGNVRFTFRLRELIGSENIFWVEKIDEYNPSAYRYLVTDQDRLASPHLISYRGIEEEGPWLINPDFSQQWNGNICLELMFEKDLPLTNCIQMDLVNHHSNLCNKSKLGLACSEKDADQVEVGARFLSAIAARNIEINIPCFQRQEGGTINFEDIKQKLIDHIITLTQNFTGTIVHGNSDSSSLARAICNAYAHNYYEVANLAKMYRSDADLRSSISSILNDLFN